MIVPPAILVELRIALNVKWITIPQETIQRFIRTMRNRCRQCISSKGCHAGY